MKDKMNTRSVFYRFTLLILFAICFYGLDSQAFVHKTKIIDENTGVSGTIDPTIPEPLNFDLVRPLGAKKGEFEINTLGIFNIRGNNFFNWGPEVEFVIANGYAMEFELPFIDNELEEFKIALQGTLSDDPNNKFIHGWQTIQRVNLHDYAWEADLLYIYGYRFNRNWSTLSLVGFRQSLIDDDHNTSFLNNTSLFRRINSKVKLGIETNWQSQEFNNSDSFHQINILPQVHFELGKHYSIQLAAGTSKMIALGVRPSP